MLKASWSNFVRHCLPKLYSRRRWELEQKPWEAHRPASLGTHWLRDLPSFRMEGEDGTEKNSPLTFMSA